MQAYTCWCAEPSAEHDLEACPACPQCAPANHARKLPGIMAAPETSQQPCIPVTTCQLPCHTHVPAAPVVITCSLNGAYTLSCHCRHFGCCPNWRLQQSEIELLIIKCDQDEIFAPSVRYAKSKLVPPVMEIASWHFCNGNRFVDSCLEGYHAPS